MKKFKPNLIPNNRDGSFNEYEAIEKQGVSNFIFTHKKDGVRLEVLPDGLMSRSMKPPRSVNVLSKFQPLVEVCKASNIVLEGEFYSHGMKFNEIYRFYSNTDVTSAKERKKLENMQKKFLVGYETDENGVSVAVYSKEQTSPDQLTQFDIEFGGRNIEWLTTFHDSLKFWWFDGFIIGQENDPYEMRMHDIANILNPIMGLLGDILVFPEYLPINTIDDLKIAYNHALSDGWEGIVATHKDHVYKFGRNSLKEATILKFKDYKNEYDGVVIDIEEGTRVKDGVARGVDEFGYSTTSNFKDDREPNGMAKGIVTEYNGERFTVALKGFCNEQKEELLNNKEHYIGMSFKYTAMLPTKNVPRHAYFECWRDSK